MKSSHTGYSIGGGVFSIVILFGEEIAKTGEIILDKNIVIRANERTFCIKNINKRRVVKK